jgi:hypothetical protein
MEEYTMLHKRITMALLAGMVAASAGAVHARSCFGVSFGLDFPAPVVSEVVYCEPVDSYVEMEVIEDGCPAREVRTVEYRPVKRVRKCHRHVHRHCHARPSFGFGFGTGGFGFGFGHSFHCC